MRVLGCTLPKMRISLLAIPLLTSMVSMPARAAASWLNITAFSSMALPPVSPIGVRSMPQSGQVAFGSVDLMLGCIEQT